MLYDTELMRFYIEDADDRAWLRDKIKQLTGTNFPELLAAAMNGPKGFQIQQAIQDVNDHIYKNYEEIGEFLFKVVEDQAFEVAVQELGRLKKIKSMNKSQEDQNVS